MLGKEAENKLSLVPLSNDVVESPINDISEDILSRVVADLKASPTKFSIQLDETTDVANLNQLIAFVRYIKGPEIKEEFFFCKQLIRTAKDIDVKNILDDFFTSNGLSLLYLLQIVARLVSISLNMPDHSVIIYKLLMNV